MTTRHVKAGELLFCVYREIPCNRDPVDLMSQKAMSETPFPCVRLRSRVCVIS